MAPQPGKESFANNCLLARRLAERGVRFIQLFDWGWDSHGASAERGAQRRLQSTSARKSTSRSTALLTDLKQRGLLEDTLVVWGGEFGRTPMQENRGGSEMAFVGRDHNPGAFTIWMAGGGVKPGITYGETDPIGYEAIDRQGLRPRPPRDDAAPAGLRSREADLSRRKASPQRLTNITKPGSKVVKGVLA